MIDSALFWKKTPQFSWVQWSVPTNLVDYLVNRITGSKISLWLIYWPSFYLNLTLNLFWFALFFFLISNCIWDSLCCRDLRSWFVHEKAFKQCLQSRSGGILQLRECCHTTWLNAKLLAGSKYWFSCCPTSPQSLFCNIWQIWDYCETLSLSLLRAEQCGETFQLSFKENPKEKGCESKERGKIQQKAFSCWEWVWCQEGSLAVMDGSPLIHWPYPGSGGDCWGSDGSPGRWDGKRSRGRRLGVRDGGQECRGGRRAAAWAGAVPVLGGAVGRRAALPRPWGKETDFI